MLTFDPVSELHARLLESRRLPDGLLHPSGDLVGSLRHAQLRAAGAPMIESDVVQEFRMALGTMAHSWLEQKFRSAPVMNEVRLDSYMPEGWTGTADALFWNDERKAFCLVDYKTVKPAAIPFLHRDGIKESWLWQASSYWWACKEMGIPLINGFGILCMPIEQLRASDGFVRPAFLVGTPLSWETIGPVMVERWEATEAYLNAIDGRDTFLTDLLAPVQSRVQKLMAAKKDKPGQRDVILVPHWSASFCPFPEELCDCRTQGTTKIGHYLNGDYIARSGYEDIIPTV